MADSLPGRFAGMLKLIKSLLSLRLALLESIDVLLVLHPRLVARLASLGSQLIDISIPLVEPGFHFFNEFVTLSHCDISPSVTGSSSKWISPCFQSESYVSPLSSWYTLAMNHPGETGL